MLDSELAAWMKDRAAKSAAKGGGHQPIALLPGADLGPGGHPAPPPLLVGVGGGATEESAAAPGPSGCPLPKGPEAQTPEPSELPGPECGGVPAAEGASAGRRGSGEGGPPQVDLSSDPAPSLPPYPMEEEPELIQLLRARVCEYEARPYK